LSGGISAAALASDAGTFAAEKKSGEDKKGDDKKAGDSKKGDEEKKGPENTQGGEKHAEDHGRGVQVNGRITAIDVAARTITVGTSKVNVPLTAAIRHGNRSFTLADLAVGDHVQVKGTANEGVLVASEVKVEQGGEGDDDDDDEGSTPSAAPLTGAVASLTGTCPALTFNIGTTKVTTTATTTFSGVTCATIANATFVAVKGTKQADGSIVATSVSTEAKAAGAVSTPTGTCPALTFNILTTKITTSATTTFFGVTCAAIADGTMVNVEGTLQADGSIAATHVSN
jgi:hypothetical protein